MELKDEHQDGSVRSRKHRASRRSDGVVAKIPTPKNQLGNEQSTYIQGLTQREALRENLTAWGIQPEPPDDQILEAIMEAGTRYGANVDQIIELCDSKIAYSSPHRTQTHTRDYPWFVTTVANHFRIEKQKTQGLAHAIDGVDMDNPKLFRRMTGSF